jgi:hypothetical protein
VMAVNVCLTHHERLDEKGNVLVSAALRQIEGRDKQHFMVMVPLGKLTVPRPRDSGTCSCQDCVTTSPVRGSIILSMRRLRK